MEKVKKIREIPSKVKVVKELKKEDSQLESEIREAEEKRFESFVSGSTQVDPTLSTDSSAPIVREIQSAQISQAEELNREGSRFYERTATTEESRAAYQSSRIAPSGTLPMRNVGMDSSSQSSSSLPENMAARDRLLSEMQMDEQAQNDKYSTGIEHGTRKKGHGYAWESY